MDIKKLKFIKGTPKTNEEARIQFLDSVDCWSVSSFKSEFEWLDKCIKPSKIQILINSEGGDVVRGMDAFSVIMNANSKTECIVEGLAASMGSVLLAAGDVAKMRDYGIIMIHNPFADGVASDDPVILAFVNQLKTIYKKRWGLSEEDVKMIMDGKEGEDGTWMDSEAAVAAGIIDRENVIETPMQEREKIKAALDGIKSTSKIAQVLACVSPLNAEASNESEIIKTKIKKSMDENLTSVAAALSLDKEATQADVLAKVVALGKIENQAKDLEKEKTELVTAKAALETSLSNIKGELEANKKAVATLQAKVKEFEAKEADALKASQEKLVEDAIKAGKIKAESKDQWMAIASSNFEACQNAINSIEGTVVISEEIEASAESNNEAREDASDDVQAVIGEFKFETL